MLAFTNCSPSPLRIGRRLCIGLIYMFVLGSCSVSEKTRGSPLFCHASSLDGESANLTAHAVHAQISMVLAALCVSLGAFASLLCYACPCPFSNLRLSARRCRETGRSRSLCYRVIPHAWPFAGAPKVKTFVIPVPFIHFLELCQ